MRDNETVTYRLEFATPADEYRYEVDRFRSNALMVRLMLAERAPGEAVLAQVRAEMGQARALDAVAARQARAGAHEAAIRSAEEANRHAGAALRLLGVPVPP